MRSTVKIMKNDRAPKHSARFSAAVASVLALASLILLTGCQGVSSGGSGQSASADLALGVQSLDFGTITAGSNKSLTVSIKNSGGAAATVNAASVSSKYFSMTAPALPVSIAAGQSAAFSVEFAPNAAGSFRATITFSTSGSNSTMSLALSGDGTTTIGQLSGAPSTLAVGSVTDGSSGTASGTLTANGGSVTITSATSSNAAFTLSGLTLPTTISAGQSAPFTVTFSPTTAGQASATLTFSSSASNPTFTLAASGTGTASSAAQLSVTPATIPIGSVVDGSSGTASGTLTAQGGNVTVTAATSNNTAFTVSGLTLPLTIAAGKTASFTVTFSPVTAGAASATLMVASSAQNSSATATLTGTGTAAPTHSVNLSWTASSSPNVVGYNIYRAAYTTSCGSYSQINTALNTSTLYTDSTVANGASYCYASTAVNTSDQESSYSNIVSNVKIPLQ